MAYRDSQAALKALYDTATRQGGYFTAKQAEAAGYTRQHIDYHVSAGNFERVERGLFRLPTIPHDEHDEFIRLSLWSRGRDDTPQAVVSHRSALALHNLSDVLPGKVHLTVPPTFRKAAPPTCELHRGRLTPSESARWQGFRVTTPQRTLLDVASEPDMPTEQLALAVHESIERGMVIARRLRETADSRPSAERLLKILDAMGEAA